MENEFYPFINLPLPYAYDAMEPYIDTQTMYLHHTRHLQTYIDNLNHALDKHPEIQHIPLTVMLENISQVPIDIRQDIRNNGGGVWNHRFYFQLLKNPSTKQPLENMRANIDRSFGSFHKFQELFKKTALSIFGSGYAWLILDNNQLVITGTINQDTPIEQGLKPVLCLDVWEHAYYLKHYNQRAAYIDDWFQIINWEQAEQNYFHALIED